MFFIRRRKVQQQELEASKQRVMKKIDAAQKATRRVNKLLEANGITLEIKKAIGTKHG